MTTSMSKDGLVTIPINASDAYHMGYAQGYADGRSAAPRWVRCEDRYPDKDGLYMFYGDEYFTPDHNGDVDHYKTIIVGYWSHFSPAIVGKMVITHWMLLPEPPKEDA